MPPQGYIEAEDLDGTDKLLPIDVDKLKTSTDLTDADVAELLNTDRQGDFRLRYIMVLLHVMELCIMCETFQASRGTRANRPRQIIKRGLGRLLQAISGVEQRL